MKEFVEELLLRVELIDGEGNLLRGDTATRELFQFIRDNASQLEQKESVAVSPITEAPEEGGAQSDPVRPASGALEILDDVFAWLYHSSSDPARLSNDMIREAVQECIVAFLCNLSTKVNLGKGRLLHECRLDTDQSEGLAANVEEAEGLLRRIKPAVNAD